MKPFKIVSTIELTAVIDGQILIDAEAEGVSEEDMIAHTREAMEDGAALISQIYTSDLRISVTATTRAEPVDE